MDPIKEALSRPDGIAVRLRRLRTDAGLAAKDIAARTGFFASKVSRLENGKQVPSVDDIRAWVEACGADEATADELIGILRDASGRRQAWKLSLEEAGGLAGIQRSYNELAQGARAIKHCETTIIPGLLQTPEYCYEIMARVREMHGRTTDDLDEVVTERMARQRLLYEPGREFEFLICEPALRWLFCPVPVMRAQLDRLLSAIGLPRVRLGVLPLSRGLRGLPLNSYVIYESDNTTVSVDKIVELDTWQGEGALAYERHLAHLWSEAVEGEEARRLIAAAQEALPTD